MTIHNELQFAKIYFHKTYENYTTASPCSKNKSSVFIYMKQNSSKTVFIAKIAVDDLILLPNV